LNNYVLFSCVGSTDPVRNNYDGALLHIIRYYRPHAVYIFLSQEMGIREENDRRFSQGVRCLERKLAYDIEIKLIYSHIENPHDFDAFIGVFSKHIEEIGQAFPQNKILLNVSSGTPQMMAMLCLETIVSSKPLIPVQVTTPVAKANDSKVGGKDYDIAWEMSNNLDNEPDSPNRCVLPDILSFKRTLAKGQVQALINKYNYEEAVQILKGYGTEEDSSIMALLKFADYKKNLDSSAEGQEFNKIKDLAGYPKMDKECLEICEYFNIVKLLQRTDHLTDFVLRLNPLVTELQSLFLKECLGFSVDKIVESKTKRERNGSIIVEKFVKRYKIKEYDQELLVHIDQCYHGEYRDNNHINIRLQNCLIDYLLKGNADIQLNSFGEFLKNMENLNQEQRNQAAHNLCGVSEDDIINEAGMSSSKIVNKLENLIKIIFKNRCKHEIFDIFDNINAKISDELERV
jgi:CRISPR type III-A/MTUBE-associated protein Csm6